MIGKLECIRENSGDIANLTLSIKKGSLRSKKILSRQRGKSVEAHFIDKDELNYPNPNVPLFCFRLCVIKKSLLFTLHMGLQSLYLCYQV